MNSRELFNKYNRFYLDTVNKTIEVIKKDGKLVSIIKWKNGNVEISNPSESDIISWINRNCLTIGFSL